MYRFSRSIYRELAPRVIEDERDPTGCANKQKVLDACEDAIRRLTYDRRYFARPARSLFNEVRAYFAVNDQLFVWRVVESNISLALEFLSAAPRGCRAGRPAAAVQAHTRKGTPCQRNPLPGRTTARPTSTSRRPSRAASCRSKRSTRVRAAGSRVALGAKRRHRRGRGEAPARGRGLAVGAPAARH